MNKITEKVIESIFVTLTSLCHLWKRHEYNHFTSAATLHFQNNEKGNTASYCNVRFLFFCSWGAVQTFWFKQPQHCLEPPWSFFEYSFFKYQVELTYFGTPFYPAFHADFIFNILLTICISFGLSPFFTTVRNEYELAYTFCDMVSLLLTLRFDPHTLFKPRRLRLH